MAYGNGQNYPNDCACGHDYTSHTSAGAVPAGGGNCSICTDAHAFHPINYAAGPSPYYSVTALGSTQI